MDAWDDEICSITEFEVVTGHKNLEYLHTSRGDSQENMSNRAFS